MDLLGLELGFELLNLRAVLPLVAASAAVQLSPEEVNSWAWSRKGYESDCL